MRADPATRSKPLMKVPEVAALFQVDPETIRIWAREGKLKARRNPGGRTLVFSRAYIEAFLADEPEFATLNESGPAGVITTERAQ